MSHQELSEENPACQTAALLAWLLNIKTETMYSISCVILQIFTF